MASMDTNVVEYELTVEGLDRIEIRHATLPAALQRMVTEHAIEDPSQMRLAAVVEGGKPVPAVSYSAKSGWRVDRGFKNQDAGIALTSEDVSALDSIQILQSAFEADEMMRGLQEERIQSLLTEVEELGKQVESLQEANRKLEKQNRLSEDRSDDGIRIPYLTGFNNDNKLYDDMDMTLTDIVFEDGSVYNMYWDGDDTIREDINWVIDQAVERVLSVAQKAARSEMGRQVEEVRDTIREIGKDVGVAKVVGVPVVERSLAR